MMRVESAQLIPRPPNKPPSYVAQSGLGVIHYWFDEMMIRVPSLQNSFSNSQQWCIGKLGISENGKLVYNGAIIEDEELQKAFANYVDRIILGRENDLRKE